MNYAVIKSGGKQYKVISGDLILIEKNTAKKGTEIKFDDVLLLGDGANIKTKASDLASASVIGEVIDQTRGPKLTVFKKKRRHNYRRKKGHKQDLTLVKIKSIAVKKDNKRQAEQKTINLSEKTSKSKTDKKAISPKTKINKTKSFVNEKKANSNKNIAIKSKTTLKPSEEQ